MKRNFTKIIEEWHEKPVRKPLIIRGMRQTGKTWCVRDFARAHYRGAFLEVNFEMSRDWATVFERDLDPGRICDELEMMSGVRIRGGDGRRGGQRGREGGCFGGGGEGWIRLGRGG